MDDTYRKEVSAIKTKKELAQDKLNAWAPKLRCPYCQKQVELADGALVCQNNHSFDLAKQGYLNLLPNHHEEHYDQALFEARFELMNHSVFYEGIYQQIKQLLIENNLDSPNQFIIDLGTGEGTHLNFLQDIFENTQTLGLDIAKSAIQTAAKHYTDSLWMIGDLGNIPVQDQVLDGVLTLLTPSNYGETKRTLKKNGWFIKIIPGNHYLKELREIVLPKEKVSHQPEASIERFENNFTLVQQSKYNRTHILNTQDKENLIQMTPLMWNATNNQQEEARQLEEITVDLIILLGITPERE